MKALFFAILILLSLGQIKILMASDEINKQENPRLSQSQSAYLRSASQQPVQWFPWGEEAFQKAQKEDKPILLDIGAVWCHWCHVIDRESYENLEIAKLINEYFVPIKVDRDERPDIDARYQRAVSAISGEGGWPLTAFLTPQGEVFYGGTYFPPEDRWGRPGMKKLIPKVANIYREKKNKVYEDAQKISRALKSAQESVRKSGELSSVVFNQILQRMIQSFDSEFGGFGTSPKFPSEGAVELALEAYYQTKDEKYLSVVTTTLEAMAMGGIRDQLGGGFHRYSVDQFWRVPHFEIMLYVNSGLLENFAHAYHFTQNPLFKEVALEIIQYIQEELSNQETGGFFATQDADYSMEDDGGYYTWTLKEVEQVLDPVTLEVMRRYYDIQEKGEMQENPEKNVLFIAVNSEKIAKALGLSLQEVQALIQKGKESLKAARLQRKKPFVDQNLYIHWNAMMVSAYLEAFKAFGLEEAKKFALKTLDFLWDHAYEKDYGMFHIYFEEKPRVHGLLDDQIQMAKANLDAYEVTGDVKYRARAIALTEFCIQKFWDDKDGGFFDTVSESDKEGLLSTVHKSFEDSPTPSSNAVVAMVLNRLYYVTGKKDYREKAQNTLEAFAQTASQYGHYVASYARALRLHLEEPPKVVLVGKKDDPQFRYLLWASHEVYRPGKIVIPLSIQEMNDPVLSEDLRFLLSTQETSDAPLAFVCAGRACAPPTDQVKELKETIRKFGLNLKDSSK